MRLPCWLVGHRREAEYHFIRRLDGYPLAVYRSCKRCPKRLDLEYGIQRPEPPFNAELAVKWAQEFPGERP